MVNFPHETSVRVAGNDVLDAMDGWLKQNARNEWKFEFLGLDEAKTKAGSARLQVRCRFLDQADADRFRQSCADGAVLAPPRLPPVAASGKKPEPARLAAAGPVVVRIAIDCIMNSKLEIHKSERARTQSR